MTILYSNAAFKSKKRHLMISSLIAQYLYNINILPALTPIIVSLFIIIVLIADVYSDKYF